MTAKVRSPEYIARKRIREAEKRRAAREAQGFASAAEFRKFAAAQAAKLKAARTQTVIQPSVAKRQAMKADTRPGQSVDEWLAQGGRIEVLPGFQSRRGGPIPARHWTSKGAISA